jgi:N-acetylmuramoyl-L-alanine amidase
MNPVASEYFWNLWVAERMAFEASKDESVYLKIFTRDLTGLTRTYQKVNEWKPDCAIELHFNGFDGTVRGTETLYSTKNPFSVDLAMAVQQGVCKLFERDAKTDRGIKRMREGGRGFWNVFLADCPSCLVEPFFGDNREDAATAKLTEAAYPVILLNILTDFAKGRRNDGPENHRADN